MNFKDYLNLTCLTLMLYCPFTTQGQSTTDNNNPGFGKFLGYDGSGLNLDFKTADITRMRLMDNSNYTVDGYTFDNSGFLGLSITPSYFSNHEPFSLLHLVGEDNQYGPQAWGYRDWMRAGITFSHNSDFMYVGPKSNGEDISDAVIAWSDNKGQGDIGPDVLRFVFTNRANGSTSISSDPYADDDYDGVEVARFLGKGMMGVGTRWTNAIMPKRTLDVVRSRKDRPQLRLTHTTNADEELGIYSELQTSPDGNLHIKAMDQGDENRTIALGFLDDELDDPTFFTTLDVGGQARIRELPDVNPNTLIMGYEYADINADDDEDYFLGRIDMPQDSCLVLNSEGEWTDICDLSAEDCRWKDNASGTGVGNMDMYMGDDPEADCYRQNLVIGNEAGKAKFTVMAKTERDRSDIGAEVDITDSDPNFEGLTFVNKVVGLNVNASGINGQNGMSYIGTNTVGLFGKYGVGVAAYGQSEEGTGIGVHAQAENSAYGAVGVYAEAPSSPNHYAIQVVGAVTQSQPPIQLSDESIKSDIEPIESPSAILSQLSPKKYHHSPLENRNLSLEDDLQYGFVAQEIQEVLPELVESVKTIAEKDTTGFIDGTESELLGIQYTQLIPLLVAGFNEQHAEAETQETIIEDQNETIDSLENQVQELKEQMASVIESVAQMQQKTQNCCTENGHGNSTGTLEKGKNEELRLKQNVPNPFSQHTRIAYTLPRAAKVELKITDASGRLVATLVNGKMAKGRHNINWDASGVSPGVYFYSVYADGKLLTKKMIKQ